MKQIIVTIEEWPREADEELSTSLMEVSGKLQHLENLVSPVLYCLTAGLDSVIVPGIEHVCQDMPTSCLV